MPAKAEVLTTARAAKHRTSPANLKFRTPTMPKPTKQPGYLVKIEAFVPAELADTKALTELQAAVDKACALIPNATRSIVPARR
jgi:hypothetical protein